MAVQRRKAYSFRKYQETHETHIFEGTFKPEGGCKTGPLSICEKINRNDTGIVEIVTCLSENEARQRAADIGRSVCGVCVSHLYTTYEE